MPGWTLLPLSKEAVAASWLQVFLIKRIVKIHNHTSEVSDQRIRVTSEVLTCIKLIKMYAWEKPFEKIIKGTENLVFCSVPWDVMVGQASHSPFGLFFHALGVVWCSLENILRVNFSAFAFYLSDLRRKEKKLLAKSGIIQSLTTAFLFIAPTVSTTVMFLIHTCLQQKLTVSMVSAWGALLFPHIDREFFFYVFS